MSKALINCGLLVNGADYFEPYVDWFKQQQNINIAAFYTNNNKFNHINSVDSLEEVVALSDVVFSLGYWKIIPKTLIDSVKLGIINIHHSYELKYKGRHCATWAIQNGDKIHGSTLHYIDENLDEGVIIDTKACKINKNDTAYSLFMKANDIGLQLIQNNFNKILSGKKSKTEDNKKNLNCKTYKAKDLTHKINSSFFEDEKGFYDMVRSLTFPGKPLPYVEICGKKIYLEMRDE